MSQTREELAYLVGLLVEQPEEVEIAEESEDDRVIFDVRVAEPDRGAVIGRRGRIANSLRTLLDLRGEATDRRYELRILDD